ncbi:MULTISPECIES: hypothetical protein [unclassified Crossiella]|uniref:hypothetical protein n=1 Tax=unclassified Crossiella TaxID=2620835 RepID=UPI00207C2943|nr:MULTISPECIES: hypothetical protein [unclassified Crossiella]MCO1574849.1 hypothetical protein [Crossiella sp. SN42]WHT21575.1 hypothetical protein N8J89_11090 [Crossiella sp. CA-258035]
MTAELADRIAQVVLTHPSVVSLHGGAYGQVLSYLPGRKVIGVRSTGDGEPVEVGVVLRFGEPLPEVVTELRQRVRQVTGAVPVDITVVDVVEPGE